MFKKVRAMHFIHDFIVERPRRDTQVVNDIRIAIGRNIDAEKTFALVSAAAQIQFHVIRFQNQ